MKLPSKDEIRKPSKTLAGVTPIAVQVYPKACKHGICLFCPSLGVPQSYTPLSPATMRAKMLAYNSYKQVQSRLTSFKVMNHPTDKIELIIMGGTFLDYPLDYQYSFIKECYDALNGKISKDLEKAKKLNEKAKHRCVALCIETRPDVCSSSDIKRMLEFGCTRVELGVQAIDNKIYKLVNRGHKVKDVIDATKRLKENGFKVGFHIMPGLPSSNPKKDLQMFKTLFSNENFKPDQLKIYPCQVIKGSGLVDWYKKGKYAPYTKEQLESLIVKMLKITPEYVRIMRIMREIAPDYLVAGTHRIDLRRDMEAELKENKTSIKEIRYREIGFALRDKKLKEIIAKHLKLKILKYKASEGTEYFLQIVNKDNILFALLRLRINQQEKNIKNDKKQIINNTLSRGMKAAQDCKENSCINNMKSRGRQAFVRELHVYGKTLGIGEHDKESSQHKGLGKKLMKEAEKIAKREKASILKVISGVGVREYYRKLGYKLEGEYMIKRL